MEGNSGESALGGRWLIDAGRQTGERGGSVHLARSLPTDDTTDSIDASAELYRLPPRVMAADIVAGIERAAAVAGPGLLRVLDVGTVGRSHVGDGANPAAPTSLNGPTEIDQLYIVTERWERSLDPDQLGEQELREIALVLTSAVGALHEQSLVHGCLHRGAIRRVDGRWYVAHAGLAAVLSQSVAPYRPPGLHVMEPVSPAADMWNIGVILHELGTGGLLRPGTMPRVEGVPVIDYLVRRLLVPEPGHRLTAAEVVAAIEKTPLGQHPTVEATVANVSTGGVAPGAAPAATGAPASRPGYSSSRGPQEQEEPVRSSAERRSRPAILLAGGAAAVAVAVVVVALALRGGDASGVEASSETDRSVTLVESEQEQEQEQDQDQDQNSGSQPAAGSGAENQTAIPGTVSLAALEIGDCVGVALGLGVIDTADRVGCDEDHVGEIIAIGEAPPAKAAYPGRAELLDEGRSRCTAAFEPYVGAHVLTTVLNTTTLVPSFAQWESGVFQTDLCLVTRFDGKTLARSVEGGFQEFRIAPGTETVAGKIIAGWCFEPTDGDLRSSGKQQPVDVVACTDLHRHEVVEISQLPVDDRDETGNVIDPNRFLELAEAADAQCEERLAELGDVLGDEKADATVLALVPDVDDWQLGDRWFQCVLRWPEPVLASVHLTHSLATSSTTAAESAERDG